MKHEENGTEIEPQINPEAAPEAGVLNEDARADMLAELRKELSEVLVPTLQQSFEEKAQAEMQGLAKKNEELLGNYKDLQTKLDEKDEIIDGLVKARDIGSQREMRVAVNEALGAKDIPANLHKMVSTTWVHEHDLKVNSITGEITVQGQDGERVPFNQFVEDWYEVEGKDLVEPKRALSGGVPQAFGTPSEVPSASTPKSAAENHAEILAQLRRGQ